MKLVPNMDQHNFLLKRMQLVGGPESGYNGLESTVEYDTKALGDPNAYLQFFEWNGAMFWVGTNCSNEYNFWNFKFSASFN